MPDVEDTVAFDFGDSRLEGTIVDVIRDAEYGTGPYELFLVDVPGAGSYRVREADVATA